MSPSKYLFHPQIFMSPCVKMRQYVEMVLVTTPEVDLHVPVLVDGKEEFAMLTLTNVQNRDHVNTAHVAIHLAHIGVAVRVAGTAQTVTRVAPMIEIVSTETVEIISARATLGGRVIIVKMI